MQAETRFDMGNKLIWCDLMGFADVAKTKQAVDEFEASLPTFPVQDFTIVINSEKLHVFKPDILPILEHCYKNIYEKFGRCIMVDPENAVAKSQLRRVARNTDFSGTFVNTKQDALNMMNA